MTNLNTDTGNRNKLRFWLELAGWIGLVSLLWGTDLLAKLSVHDQAGEGKDTFRLVSEQVTSGIAVLIMIGFLIQWVRLFPPSLSEWARTIVGHTMGSVIFAFGHFALMVAMRIPWYSLNGRSYVWRDPFVANLIVEYQKDIKIYIGFVVIIVAYQHYRQSKTKSVQPHADRLIVQTSSGDTVLPLAQIDYLEAARNYIAVHADGREYIIRETMSSVMQRLAGGSFARTHRSYIVNIDKVREIRSVDSGRRVILHSGDDVPLSRGYRDEFSKAIAGESPIRGQTD